MFDHSITVDTEMKSSLVLSIFCVSALSRFLQTEAWLGLEKANRTNVKKFEKHCFGIIFNLGPMENGEIKRLPGACAQATCMNDRNVKFSGCPFVALSDRVGCRVYKGDLSKEFPDCCYQVKCDDQDTTEEIYAGYVNITAVDLKSKKS